MNEIIDIFEEKATITTSKYNCEIRLPEEYVGHDCIITNKENVEIYENNLTILNKDLQINRRLRPFRKGESRLRLPKKYLNKTVIILIKNIE